MITTATPPKIITPEELGFPFPEMMGISIGKISRECSDFGPLGGAHVHKFPDDPYNHVACFSSENIIFKYGTKEPSELMWHEYFHVLDPFVPEMLEADQKYHHGESWKRIAYEFERPWIAASGMVTPDSWFYNPPQRVKVPFEEYNLSKIYEKSG